MANIFEFLSKDGNITPEKARQLRQMQFHDKTAYVWGLRYRWDPSLSRNPVPRFPHFMPPWLNSTSPSIRVVMLPYSLPLPVQPSSTFSISFTSGELIRRKSIYMLPSKLQFLWVDNIMEKCFNLHLHFSPPQEDKIFEIQRNWQMQGEIRRLKV